MLGTWIFSILLYFIYFLNADLWHSLMNINSQFKVKNALSVPIITLQWVTGDKSNNQKASCPSLDLPFPIAVWLWASYLTFLTSSQKWNDTCMILHNLFERTGEMLPMKSLSIVPCTQRMLNKCSVESHLRSFFHVPDKETLILCDLLEVTKPALWVFRAQSHCFHCLLPLKGTSLWEALRHCFSWQSRSLPLVPSSYFPNRWCHRHFPAPGSTLRSWFLTSNTPGLPFPFCSTLNVLNLKSQFAWLKNGSQDVCMLGVVAKCTQDAHIVLPKHLFWARQAPTCFTQMNTLK